MIDIRIAKETDAEVLALLGRVTYIESHAHFVNNKADINHYANEAYAVSKIREELKNENTKYYLACYKELPVGFVKLVLDSTLSCIDSEKTIRLEKNYVLEDFIECKIGKKLLEFSLEKVIAYSYESIWLTVYIKNIRAIKFYHKYDFTEVGKMDYIVNGKKFENDVLFKKIE